MENTTVWLKGVRFKLLVIILGAVIVTSIVGATGLYGMKEQADDLHQIAHERIPRNQVSAELRITMNTMLRFMWRALTSDRDTVARRDALQGAYDQIALFEAAEKKMDTMKLREDNRKLFDSIKTVWRDLTQTLHKVRKNLELNTKEGDREARRLMLDDTAEDAKMINQKLNEFSENVLRVTESIVKEADETTENVRRLTITMIGGGALALLILGITLAARLALSLNRITSQLSSASLQVASASEHLSRASQQLSSGATEGAASLEETVSSIEELSGMVKLNSDHATEAANLARKSNESAASGETEIGRLIQSMGAISESSKKIEEIISVIDDIAFQTNLLALNAAVEAARAGEQGKGFAVVAEAVRNLAQRSAAAAKDISSLITESVDKTESGVKVADESAAVLKTIVSSVKKVSSLNDEIASASFQQSNGISQISQAMNQLDQVTQSNAASAEESAAAAEELSAQAELLKGLVIDLQKVVNGEGTSIESLAKDATTQELRRPARREQKASSSAPKVTERPTEKLTEKKSKAASVIPFDDDETPPKGPIGSTDGF